MPPFPLNDESMNNSEEPPEPYSTWEEYFEDFDRQLEAAPRITIRKRTGNSKIRSIDEINGRHPHPWDV